MPKSMGRIIGFLDDIRGIWSILTRSDEGGRACKKGKGAVCCTFGCPFLNYEFKPYGASMIRRAKIGPGYIYIVRRVQN